jgi:hypothetical protein
VAVAEEGIEVVGEVLFMIVVEKVGVNVITIFDGVASVVEVVDDLIMSNEEVMLSEIEEFDEFVVVESEVEVVIKAAVVESRLEIRAIVELEFVFANCVSVMKSEMGVVEEVMVVELECGVSSE